MVMIFIVLFFLFPGFGEAHELHYTVVRGEAVVVQLQYADQTDLAQANYNIYRAGEEKPFQTGRTDARGRIVFLPEEKADWRIKVFTEDGHGLQITLDTAAGGATENVTRTFFERYARIVTGISVIFGLFGIISLWAGKRKG